MKARLLYYAIADKIHFMRILQAQPLMDDNTIEGNVVVERVFQSLRLRHPQVISEIVHKPDFRLVPKDEEEAFCQWSKIRDYDPAVDADRKPKFMEMPPLLRKVMERNRRARGEATKEEDFLLPAHSTYTGDHILEDTVEANDLSQFIGAEYATYKDFDAARVPDSWNYDRLSLEVGTRKYAGYMEGKEWEEHQRRDAEEAEAKAALAAAARSNEQA